MKKYLLIILAIAAQTAMAQNYQLIVTSVSHSGKCGMTNKYDYDGLGGALWNAISNQQSQLFNGKIYSSKQLCEASLHSMSGTFDGCTTKVSGYCRPLGGVDASIGNANVLGVNQGSSFYSINGANEIRDWSNDDMERMLALNKEYKDMSPSMLATGDDAHDQRLAMLNDNHDFEDYMIVGGARIPVSVLNKPFVSVNMREDLNQVEMANDFSYLANKENVQKYVDYCRNLSDLFMDLDNPYSGDFTMLLHQKFKEISGFDLDAIMQKLPSERTEAEKQALLDYQKFRKEVTDKIIADIDDRVAHLDEVKDFEMAALSGNSYKDSDGHYFPLTNYKEVNTYKGVNSDYLVGNQPIIGLSDLIDECNSTKPETGFHAELYYNEKTKEYTLAFEGTNFDEPADIRTDYEIGTNEVPEQYRLAYKIAKYLTSSDFPSDIKINITGHSLGGGLASIVGLVTGKPTYTYNAAGLNEKTKNEFGLNGLSANSIKAFQDNNDILTSVQEGVAKPAALGVASMASYTFMSNMDGMISGGNTSKNPTSAEGERILKELSKGNIAAPTVGNKIEVEAGGWHRINPVTNTLMIKKNDATLPYSFLKEGLYEKGHGVEYQTQESILILTES